MQHVVHPLDCTYTYGEVGQVPLEELHGGQVRQVTTFAGREVVDDPDDVSAADQLLSKVRADEAGAAGDQIRGHRLVLRRVSPTETRRAGLGGGS